MARTRFFTVGEVEQLIPTLERIFAQVIQLRIVLRGQERRLEQAGVRLSREALESASPREPFEIRHAKALFRGCYETLADQLAQVGELGGEVKDLEAGLVDFPGRRGDEEILLCWKFGEKKIEYWHTLEAGFAGRRQIDELVPREPPPLD